MKFGYYARLAWLMVRFHGLPWGSLKADGLEGVFQLKRYVGEDGTITIGHLSENPKFGCVLTNDGAAEQAVIRDLADYPTNVTATLKILGETIAFGMNRQYVKTEQLPGTDIKLMYAGLFSHEFKQVGHMVGVVEILIEVREYPPKQRRKRMVLPRVELPDWKISGIFPQEQPLG